MCNDGFMVRGIDVCELYNMSWLNFRSHILPLGAPYRYSCGRYLFNLEKLDEWACSVGVCSWSQWGFREYYDLVRRCFISRDEYYMLLSVHGCAAC